MQNEVLIVGAGPTGLVLALTLDRFNVPFTIVEKKTKPDNISKAIAVVPGTLEHYSQLGIVEEVLAEGISPKEVILYSPRDSVTIDFFAFQTPISRYAQLFTYPQDEHERFLVKKLEERGHEVKWQTKFSNLEQTDEKVTVQLRTEGATFYKSFRYVVGADGGSSTIRNALDIDFPGETNEKIFFVADVELGNEIMSHEVIHGYFQHQDFVLNFPLRDQTTRRLIGIIPAEVVREEEIYMEDIIPIFKERFNLDILKADWFSEYKIHHRLAKFFKKGNVFLAGDAAHLHSPVGGQGMNAGIADAVNLGWKLANVINKKVPEKILDTYEEERKDYARKLIQTTDRAFKLETMDNLFTNKIRKYLLTPLVDYTFNKTNSISDRLFKTISQTHIQYTSSALNALDVSDKLLGQRLPYFKNNLDFTDEMKWHVQIYGEVRSSFRDFLEENAIPYVLLNWDDAMKKVDFTENAAYLIRPDGYIAWISPQQDLESLKQYIDGWSIFK